MSEISSLPEDDQVHNPCTICPICSVEQKGIRPLKTHLLLKHPKVNLCLFCIEKKGWSDTFVNQASYNLHYTQTHEGILEQKEKIKEEDRKWKKEERIRVNKLAQELGQKPPKRLRKRHFCGLCQPRIEFESLESMDRHLIAEHSYDYCQICSVIGAISMIRQHILDLHHDEESSMDSQFSCYICCGSGPVFESKPKLSLHLVEKHALKAESIVGQETTPDSTTLVVTEYPCYDCDLQRRKKAYSTAISLKEHLMYKHEPMVRELRAMHKRKPTIGSYGKVGKKSNSTCTSLLPPLRTIIGIKNSSGFDCFSISVLHLLAQTDLAKSFKSCDKISCRSASCLLGQFFSEYLLPKKVPLEVGTLAKNYQAFGLNTIQDIDCGDFLRGALRHAAYKEKCLENDVENLCFNNIEWKFECPKCKRFMTMAHKDFVLKISVKQEKSLDNLLHDFLNTKSCPCGQMCMVEPTIKKMGKYVFLEIDRTVVSELDSTDSTHYKDIRLFSLKLQPSYKLLGFQYAVLGTVNYYIQNEDGGHYITYFFPSPNECITIHEYESKPQWKKPDFDTETVIVALAKIELDSADLNNLNNS